MAVRMTAHRRAMPAALLLGLAAAPSPAAALLFSFSYAGPDVTATGLLTTTDTLIGGAYLVTDISGTRNGETINGLLAPSSLTGNDNLLFPDPYRTDEKGIAYRIGGLAYVLFLDVGTGEACVVLPEKRARNAKTATCAASEIDGINAIITPVPTVPEPATALLLGAGLLSLGLVRSTGLPRPARRVAA